MRLFLHSLLFSASLFFHLPVKFSDSCQERVHKNYFFFFHFPSTKMFDELFVLRVVNVEILTFCVLSGFIEFVGDIYGPGSVFCGFLSVPDSLQRPIFPAGT